MALQFKTIYIQEQAQWDLSLIFFLFSLVIWCKGKKSSEKKKSVFWFVFFHVTRPALRQIHTVNHMDKM